MKPTKAEKQFWQMIREKRIALGIRQQVFAKKMKVSRTTLVNLELGTHRGMFEHALIAAKILGINRLAKKGQPNARG